MGLGEATKDGLNIIISIFMVINYWVLFSSLVAVSVSFFYYFFNPSYAPMRKLVGPLLYRQNDWDIENLYHMGCKW